MATNSWSPENFDIPNRQNFILWQDMERAYAFIEANARYSISGDMEGFLFELVRKRWNLACANIFEPPPDSSQKFSGGGRENLLSTMPAGLSLANIDKISLTKSFANNFKKFVETISAPAQQPAGGKLYGYGTDGYGTYVPLHLLWPDMKSHWGIHISESGVLHLAAAMYKSLPKGQMNLFEQDQIEQIGRLIQIAYQVILRHQLFHFKIEQWALLFEFSTGRAYYLPYLQYVYLPTLYDPEERNLEEALANLSILLSKKIQKLQKEEGLQDTQFAILDFLNQQGPSYRNYDLKKGVPTEIRQSDQGLHYREVINYLCNQIIRHEIHPALPLTPYHLYPPNNNFLRAENLCPIYLIRNLNYNAGVIA
jgi:hypothetical protein